MVTIFQKLHIFSVIFPCAVKLDLFFFFFHFSEDLHSPIAALFPVHNLSILHQYKFPLHLDV